MALVTDTWLVDCLLLVVSLLAVFYWYLTNTANYFRDRGIAYIPQTPLLGCRAVFKMSQFDLSMFLYKAFPKEKYYGYFQVRDPILLVKDPEIIQRIFVKDFAHFHDRGFAIAEQDTLNGFNLFNLKGYGWRYLRHKLIPTFSTGKLKQMFDQLDKCGDNLLEDVEQTAIEEEAVNIRLFMAGFTSEVIGTTAFGLDLKRSSPQATEFNDKIRDLFDTTYKMMVIFFTMLIFPKVAGIFKLSITPSEVKNYFVDLVKANKTYRKTNNIKRNDYFQLLLTLQEEAEGDKVSAVNSSSEKYEEDALIDQMNYVPQDLDKSADIKKLLSDESLTAQSFVFLTAGTESVSSTIGFVLYHAGKDHNVQKLLREEVDSVLAKHGKCTYQAIKEMTYMDQVLQEAMRMYPIVSLNLRECTMPYQIPGSDKVIEKGTIVAVAVAGLHMDPQYHPNPQTFDPDRFIDNNFKPSSTFMPFGDGPRICIGMRFAILEIKVSLCKVFSKYSVEVNSKTKEPFVFEAKSFFPRPEGGIWLNFKKRS